MSSHSSSTATAYVFSSAPRAIAPRKKYREPLYLRNTDSVDLTTSNCIQWDKRVSRGITVTKKVAPPTEDEEQANVNATLKDESRQRWLDEARTAAKDQMKVSYAPQQMEVTRKHIEVDLSAFLIEEEKPVDVAVMQTQTDVFQPRPPSPDYVPRRTGVDVATQILSGDLWDYNREIDLILDVITGKTLEQSMMEVQEEEELAALKAHQDHFEALEEANRDAIKKMELAESTLFAERQELLRKARKKAENELRVRNKVHATLFADSFLDGLEDTALDSLAERGYFFDPLERTVELDFMPWLSEKVETEVNKKAVSRVLVDKVIQGAIERSKLEQKKRQDDLMARAKAEKAALAKAARVAREEYLENNLELIVNIPGLRGNDAFEAALKAAGLDQPTITCNVDQRFTAAQACESIAVQVAEQLDLERYAPGIPFNVKSISVEAMPDLNQDQTLQEQELVTGKRVDAVIA